jgi:hypothetical protein
MYTVQFIDKSVCVFNDLNWLTITFYRSTLSYTAVLGIIKDANLTTDDFNTLGSAFYIGTFELVWGDTESLSIEQVTLCSSTLRILPFSISLLANG